MKTVKNFLIALFCLPTIAAAQDQGVLVIVEAVAKPGNVDAVISAFKNSQSRCSEWPGCQRFEVTRSERYADKVILIEQWQSIDDHRKEVQSVMAGETFPQFRQLLSQDLSFHYLVLQ